MVIWGWGKVTRSVKGLVFQKKCDYCNTISEWRLCIIRKWFTLFFIPIIPYKSMYCVECPNCHSYMELGKEKYTEVYQAIQEREKVVIETQQAE